MVDARRGVGVKTPGGRPAQLTHAVLPPAAAAGPNASVIVSPRIGRGGNGDAATQRAVWNGRGAPTGLGTGV